MTIATRKTTWQAQRPESETNWRVRGLCAQTDPELFFPIGASNAAKWQEIEAKRICMMCPVRATCLEWALETRQESGVWGGLSEDERRSLHRKTLRSRRPREESAVAHILRERLPEFEAAVAAGMSSSQIAQAMRTNTQTVNNVSRALQARQELAA